MKKYRRESASTVLDKEVSSSRRKKAWMFIVVAVMVMSVIGFMSIDWGENEKYNGFNFIQTERGWKAEINNKFVSFFYHPSQVDAYSISNETKKKIAGLKDTPVIYFTLAYNDSARETIGMIEYDLLEAFKEKNMELIYAFTGENEFNKLIIDCANATSYMPVIKFQSDLNITNLNITSNNNCIEVTSGSQMDFLLARDLFLYTFYGVITSDRNETK